MKRGLRGVVLLVAVGAIGAGDVLQQLRVPASEAGDEVIRALASGSPNYQRVREVFKAASPSVRAALVEQTFVWAKAYINSPAFATAYAAYRRDELAQAKAAGVEALKATETPEFQAAERQQLFALLLEETEDVDFAAKGADREGARVCEGLAGGAGVAQRPTQPAATGTFRPARAAAMSSVAPSSTSGRTTSPSITDTAMPSR
jgi:hypothetical protein